MEPTTRPIAENSHASFWGCIKALPTKAKNKVVDVAGKAKNLGRDERMRRRIVHCLKVGLALDLISLLYFVYPLYMIFQDSGISAVSTVVVVLESTVGGTLESGLNQTAATLLGGALGVGAEYLSALSGETGQPILLGFLIMIIGAALSYVRFVPELKARYDSGMLVVLLTFCLVSVSGYRDKDAYIIAYKKLLTSIIGCVVAVLVCIFICPVWVGEDLQKLVAANLEKLGIFLEGFSGAYYRNPGDAQTAPIDQSLLQGYKSILASKHTEETMVNSARWEPCHGRFLFRHPLRQYLKVGALAWQCSYKIESLSTHLTSEIHNHNKIQATREITGKIQESCREMTKESGRALKQLAAAIRSMKRPTSMAIFHIQNSKAAAKNLMSLIETDFLESSTSLLETIPAVAVASTVMDIVTCTERISEAVTELAFLAQFKTTDPVLGPEEP